MKTLKVALLLLLTSISFAQSGLKGTVTADGMPLPQANILINKASKSIVSDADGNYFIKDLAAGDYEIAVSYTGFRTEKRQITLIDSTETILDFKLREDNSLDEVVITGTMKPVSRLESPVPVEVYKPTFFKKNFIYFFYYRCVF